MDEAIRDLLDALEAAETAGAPLTDTVIRESLYDVADQGFIHQVQGYRVPQNILLDYSEEAARHNATVIQALEAFLVRAQRCAANEGLATPEARESAFMGSEATSTSGIMGSISTKIQPGTHQAVERFILCPRDIQYARSGTHSRVSTPERIKQWYCDRRRGGGGGSGRPLLRWSRARIVLVSIRSAGTAANHGSAAADAARAAADGVTSGGNA